jgi:hypothetical protein
VAELCQELLRQAALLAPVNTTSAASPEPAPTKPTKGRGHSRSRSSKGSMSTPIAPVEEDAPVVGRPPLVLVLCKDLQMLPWESTCPASEISFSE